MERRIKLTIEYDGTNYAGWQHQDNAVSIQDVLESALTKLLNGKIVCFGSGRTDAGVHAKGQVVHFDTTSTISLKNIVAGANSYLPEDISVVSAEIVPSAFDARRSAVLRWYRYRILYRNPRSAIDRSFAAHIPYKLDLAAMEEALALLKGQHDFAAFRKTGCTATRTQLNLEYVKIFVDGDVISIDLKCRSFLYNMVRIIVGLLLEIGRGKLPMSTIEEMFNAKTCPMNIPTAPAKGLTLMAVSYPSYAEKLKIK